MAPSRLEACPPEILEYTAQYLALDDLRNLRLANKAVSSLVAQETFKRYYRTKHVDVSPEALAEFAHMTGPGLLGGELESLVLTGFAIDTQHLEKIIEEKARWETEGNGPIFASTQHKLSSDELAEAEKALDALRARGVELEEFSRSGDAVRLLAGAFSNMAAYGKSRKLASLTLEIVLVQEDMQKRLLPIQTRAREVVWQAAKTVFRAAIGGLAGSGMPLEKLDVFTEQWHCSLAASAIGCIGEFEGQKLAPSLRNLQSLSMSLSAEPKSTKKQADTPDEEDGSKDNESTQHADGLASFLEPCQSLTQLHLHWFLLRSAGVNNPLGEALLTQAVEMDRLNNLQNLTLRGFRFTGPTLLSLLKKAPVRDLRLENVTIKLAGAEVLPDDHNDSSGEEGSNTQRAPVTSAAWTAIFQHCTSAEAAMSSLYFNDLWGATLIHFLGEPNGQSKMPWTPHTGGGETLNREGADGMRDIQYAYARGRPLGSPQAYRWRQIREREYGPA